MAVTENFGWPLPDETATVKEEVERLRDQTLPAIDADVHALGVEVSGKADDDHSHAIGDVTGLTTALDGKMPASTTFAVGDLTDVVGADAAPDGYVLVKVGDEWVAQAAAAAIGDHDHTMDQVVGLEDAINGGAIHAATNKGQPVDADEFGVWDSVSGLLRKVTWANIVAKLAGIFARRIDVRRNLWVNGSFKDSQENGNTLGTTNGYYPADQIALFFVASAAAMSVQRVQARTLANASDQIEFKTTTAKASLAAGDYVTLTQNIEGSSFAESGFGTANAKPYVHRFQVTLPAGTYHWHFSNSAGNRHCAVPFTIAAGEANSPVVKEVVVPADTSGTWLTADGVIGLTAELVLAVGSTRVGGTASTWSGTTYFAATTQFNILGSTSNVARLADVGTKIDPDATGVYGQYEVGETDAVYRPERYYLRLYAPPLRGWFSGSGAGRLAMPVPVAMAKAPATVGITGSINLYDGTVSSATISSVTGSYCKTNVIEFDVNMSATAGYTTGRSIGVIDLGGGGSITVSARLS